MPKQRLELTWIGKNVRSKLEPRILLEDPARSYHAPHCVSDKDIFDNLLIHGDNLLALKALEQKYTDKIKCIYIDPPYNTGKAFEYYDDGVEHSIWLSLMRERFIILRNLMTKDGIFCCHLNDDEAAYAKVMLDEIFGRKNFLNQISVKMKQTAGASGGGEDKRLKKNIEYILIYAKDKNDGFVKFNDVYDEEDLFEYIEWMKEEGKSWKYTRIVEDFGEKVFYKKIKDGSGEDINIFKHNNVIITPITSLAARNKISEEECYIKYFDRVFRDTNAQSSIRTRVIDEVSGKFDFCSIEYIPRSGKNKGKKTALYYKGNKCDLFAWLSDVAVKKGNRLVKLEKTGTYWDGFPLNNLTKEGGVLFPQGKKPEALIQKVFELATKPGDLVLDSFLGSGTTAAVAHKMGRRWIGIELGEHCYTHCIPRLQKVINGEDPGGITKAQNWQGGGGFRFYELAPSLIKLDPWDIPIINPAFNAEMLAEAVCKLHGYRYAPSADWFWMHGEGHKNSHIYVTTQTLTTEILQYISDQVGESRSLLICCPPCPEANAELFPNINLSIMPNALLKRYEWDHDDYSLNVKNLPQAEPQPSAPAERTVRAARDKKAKASGQIPLFDLPKGGAE